MADLDYIQSVSASDSNATSIGATLSSARGSGNTLVANVFSDGTPTHSMSDPDYSEQWTDEASGGSKTSQFKADTDDIGSDTQTFEITGGNDRIGITVYEIEGETDLEDSSTADSGGSEVNNLNLGTITIAGNAIVIAGCSAAGGINVDNRYDNSITSNTELADRLFSATRNITGGATLTDVTTTLDDSDEERQAGGVSAFKVRATGTDVPVPVGSAELSGFAPTVVAPETINVPAGSLSLSGSIPTAVAPNIVAIPIATLNMAGQPPTVLAPETINIPVGVINFSGLIPTVDAPADVAIEIPVGVLNLAGNAPTAIAPENVEIPRGLMNMAGSAPTIDAPNIIPIQVGSLNFSGKVPLVVAPETINVPVGAMSADGFAPTIDTGANVTVQIPIGAINLSGNPPSIVEPNIVPIGAGSLNLTGFVPVANAPEIIDVTTGAINFSGFAPTPDAPISVIIPVGSMALAGNVPAIIGMILEADIELLMSVSNVLNRRMSVTNMLDLNMSVLNELERRMDI